MAAEVCVMSGHPCLVMHNTTLIYERYPEDWSRDDRMPMVCFNVWGDHGFFYERSASLGISHMKVRNPKHLHDKQLSSRFDEDDQTNYKNMVPFTTVDAIGVAISEEKNIVFWTLN